MDHQSPGKVIHQKSTPVASSFVSRTLPDIPKDSVILAVCPVDLSRASHSEDGWQVADMFAFKYLLKRASTNQKWICGASETDIFNKYGEYVHGDPYNVRKVVLSQQLLDQEELTPLTVVRQERMKREVLDQISKASAYAKESKQPLLIFFFAHGKPRSFDIQLDPDDEKSDLNIHDVKKALDSRVSTTITTACCFSGGWAINPEFNTTVLTAASPHQVSQSWAQAESARGRYGGSVFTSTMIKTLCDESSPLVEPKLVQQMLGLELGSSPSTISLIPASPVKPRNPTPNQMHTYNAFIHEINRTLRQDFSKSCRHEFHFSAENDEWEQAWIKRIGFPLGKFQIRWDSLQDYYGQPYRDRVARVPSYTDEGPDNPDYSDLLWEDQRDNDEGDADDDYDDEDSLGYDSAQPTSPSSKRASHQKRNARGFKRMPLAGFGIFEDTGGLRRLKVAAQRHIRQCPEDWTDGSQSTVHGLLTNFITGGMEATSRAYEVIQTLKFREEVVDYANITIDIFQLKPPTGATSCADWAQYRSLDGARRSNRGKPYNRYQVILQRLRQKGCDFQPILEQGRYWENQFVILLRVSA